MKNNYLFVRRYSTIPILVLLFVLFYGQPTMTDDANTTAVLLSQNELITHTGQGYNGADASIVEPPGTLRGSNAIHTSFRICDDFTVPTGYEWIIDSVWIYNYQNNSGPVSTITFVSMKIWNGVPNLPSSAGVFGDTTANRMIRTVFTNIYRAKPDSIQSNVRPIMQQTVNINHTVFSPGTYWLDWSVNGTSTSGPWSPPRSIWGTGITGNSKQRVSYVWTDIIDSGYAKGQAFTIFGTQVPIVGVKKNEKPVSFGLHQNFPNPFNPVTTIAFSIAKASDVILTVYDISGKEIVVLVNRMYEPGFYDVTWDAADFNSGVYLYRLTAGTYTETKKMLLLK
ncbi:T9SS type A sorting domain-containing protein [Bacteroidota bacterium]